MKIIFRTLIALFLILFATLVYLSIFGVETIKFNYQIETKLKKLNQNIEINLKEVKLILDPINFKIKAKTLGTKIKSKQGVIDIQSIKTQVPIKSLFKKDFSISNIEISTNSVELKKTVSFIRELKTNTKLLFLENSIKKGYLIADIYFEFDDDGNIKDNFKIKGFVKDGRINFFKKFQAKDINFMFNIDKKQTKLEEIYISYDDLNLFYNHININKNGKNFLVDGEIENKNFKIKSKNLKNILKNSSVDFKEMEISSNNNFSFLIDEKFRLKDFKLQSEAIIHDLILNNNFDLINIFPKIKNEILFQNHKVKINIDKKIFSIKGSGNFFLQNKKDQIDYSIKKDANKTLLKTSIILNKNPLWINFLDFKKKEDIKTFINIDAIKYKKKNILINSISLKDKKTTIKFDSALISSNYKLIKFDEAKFDYIDNKNKKNSFSIINRDSHYLLTGETFNADYLMEKMISSDDQDIDFIDKKLKLKIDLANINLDSEFQANEFKGDISFDKNEIINANLKAYFLKNEKFTFKVNFVNDKKITTLYSDKAEPFIKRYRFIKGFKGGSLDYNSIKKNNKSFSTLKLYDFKIQEASVLTKLLTLASLQGIADLLSGEGISFNEFEMNFENEGTLTTVKEIYSIGPAISMLMEGYVEKNKLVSLRGTLVPATTINKVIGSIPVLGKILVGSKTGEGVFGVSFKIKGHPKKLETTVNPIKTLTPRFITRTLEKLKKN
tara:strand:- start:3108 stop:5288 length:2181 start_codon:yes stop_codon:yes gene_type:complete